MDWAFVLAGAATGLLVGLSGVGGGALMTPLLMMGFSLPANTAVATDLWFAAITKLTGAPFHHQGGQVDWGVVKRLWAGSLPAAAIVTTWVSRDALGDAQAWLPSVIGVLIVLTAVGMLAAKPLQARSRHWRLQTPTRFKAWQTPATVLAGAFLGTCVALTSVGAGALGSVILMALYPLRMTPHRLVSTDLVHAIPLAIIAGMGYAQHGHVNLPLLGTLLVGSVPGVILGSWWSQRMETQTLRWLVAALLGAAGLKLLLS